MLGNLLCLILGHKWKEMRLLYPEGDSRRYQKVNHRVLKHVHYCERCMEIKRLKKGEE